MREPRARTIGASGAADVVVRRKVRGARLVLASASPRRTRILDSLGIPHVVIVPRIDERVDVGEAASAAARRLARAKALSVASATPLPVLAADTVVVARGQILGKPRSRRDAARMLRVLSGRAHEVVTGVCLVHRGRVACGVERTAVSFARLSREDVRWYVATGEPMDKAGAYHIDGIGALFVASIHGSPSNVEGLPVSLVRRLARRAGLRLIR